MGYCGLPLPVLLPCLAGGWDGAWHTGVAGGWILQTFPLAYICPSCLEGSEHTHCSHTLLGAPQEHTTPHYTVPLTQLCWGSVLAHSILPSPGKSNTHSVLLAALNVNLGVKGFAACPHAGLAAPSPMIYALIWECLFLPGDHMGLACTLFLYLLLLPLPPCSPLKMVFIFIKAIYSGGCQELIGFSTRSDKLSMVILELGGCLG